MMMTRSQVEAHIGIALAGRAAEELIFGSGSITTGAANDLAKATDLTARMCLEWGMDQRAGLTVHHALAPWGIAQSAADNESIVRERLEKLYQFTKDRLERESGALMALAESLLKNEWLDGEAAMEIIRRHAAVA